MIECSKLPSRWTCNSTCHQIRNHFNLNDLWEWNFKTDLGQILEKEFELFVVHPSVLVNDPTSFISFDVEIYVWIASLSFCIYSHGSIKVRKDSLGGFPVQWNDFYPKRICTMCAESSEAFVIEAGADRCRYGYVIDQWKQQSVSKNTEHPFKELLETQIAQNFKLST